MIKSIFLALALTLSVGAWAQFSSKPAFPGAEGYGRFAQGGREGTVYHVTNLSDDGKEGSLRYAVEKSGKRTVVFDVAGTIYLTSDLSIGNDYISILGQTAPGDGICVANYPVYVGASNVIIRYMRFRMGDVGSKAKKEDDPNYEGDDALGGREQANVIIDHCSVSWSTDECCSFYGNENFTLQYCIISESLKASVHAKGSHGYGGIWGGQNASFHHNLLADHDSRNCRFDHDYVSTMKGPIDYTNNVVYNWGGNSTYGGESANTTNNYRSINMENNYYKPGPASTGHPNRLMELSGVSDVCTNCTDKMSCTTMVPAHLYVKGNNVNGNANYDWSGIVDHSNNTVTSSLYALNSRVKNSSAKFNYNTISIQSAENAYNTVLAYAGASLSRDAVDTRIVNDCKNGTYEYEGSNGSTKGMIDSQTDVNGWPTLSGGDRGTDSDGDGMPDDWETANKLNPDDASDGKKYTLDTKGYYTNLEVYANSLVETITKAERQDATETFEEWYPAYNPATPETKKVVIATGTITWPLSADDDQNAVISDNIQSYVSSTSTDCGSKISFGSTVKVNDITMTQVNAATTYSAKDAKNELDFIFEPESDYFIQPTSVSFKVSKIGTDGGKFSADYYSPEFSYTLATDADAARNNETSGWYTSFVSEGNFTSLAQPTDSESKLKLYLYGFNGKDKATETTSEKHMALGNVVIYVNVLQEQAAGISSVQGSGYKVQDSGYYYNLAGQRVSPNTTGILIHNGKKVVRN